MQVEGGQTGIAAFFLASEEKAAAVGEGQQVADRCPVPATLRDPLGEQAIEQVAAPGGKEARTQVAVRRQQVLFRATARVDQVAAAVAEALQAEIIGHAVRGDTFQARVEKGTLRPQPGQTQGEAVGGMRASLQLARMTGTAKNPQVRALGCTQVGIGLARQVQAEPLPGQGLAVLQPGVADVLLLHAGGAAEATGRLLGVQSALFHPQPEVLAFTAEGNVQHLVDLEVLGHGLEHRLAAGCPMGARPEQVEFAENAHRAISKATACTAMPSSRPVKPSRSVVVALTLTWSTATPRSSAINPRMVSMCGAIFGAWATMVASTLPTFQPFSATMAQQRATVGALEPRVGVREVLADVAQRRRAEQRIGQGVQQHVAVGVGDQPMFVGNAHAAEGDEVALAEAMHVVAMANSHEKTPWLESGRDSTPDRDRLQVSRINR